MTPKSPRFSKQTLGFIIKASRQKNPEWLERHRDEYETHLLEPMQNLARTLERRLHPLAPDYRFPQKGLARMKRSARGAEEYGAQFRDYVSYSAARPRVSRFDHNPNLFFFINPEDDDGDEVLLAGGLYMPSSRQLRSIREAIAEDASAFERLFATKDFRARFPGGFSDERKATRPPRGFDPAHPRMDWLKLQAFFVWRPYRRKEFISADFPELVAADCAQILKLNALLDLALQGRLARAAKEEKPGLLTSRLAEIEAPRRRMDF